MRFSTANPAWQLEQRTPVLETFTLSLLVLLMFLPEGLDYSRLSAAAVLPTGRVGAGIESGNAVTRALWLCLAASGIFTVWRRRALARRLVGNANLWLLLAVMLATASLVWSIDPALSLRRLFRLFTILVCLTGFMLRGWSSNRLAAVLRPMVTGLLMASLAFGILAPRQAIHQELSAELLGAWRGLASHKNAFGGLACLGCLLWLHAGLFRERPWAQSMVGLLVAALCLWLSRSSTALLATLVSSALLISFFGQGMLSRRGLAPAIATLVAAGLLVGLGSVNLLPGWTLLTKPMALLSGKDVSLTGRTAIWKVMRDHIERRPVLGSGYGAYWQPVRRAGTESGEMLSRLGGFYPGSAHNGYLEVTNDLGVVGLAMLLGLIVRHAHDSLKLAGRDRPAAMLLLALLVQQCVLNLSESHWLNVTSLDFMIMTAAMLSLARHRLQHRLVAELGPLPAVAA